MNVPTLRQMRRGALARRKAIDSGALGYIGRHHVQRARTFWEASKPSWLSGLASIARALTSLRLSRRPKAPVPPHPAIVEPVVVISMLRRQAGAHRAQRPSPARRIMASIRHRGASTRQSAPARLTGRRRAAHDITAELRLNLHKVKRHAEDVGKRRGLRLIPQEWSVA